jgi:hypothetical protein
VNTKIHANPVVDEQRTPGQYNQCSIVKYSTVQDSEYIHDYRKHSAQSLQSVQSVRYSTVQYSTVQSTVITVSTGEYSAIYKNPIDSQYSVQSVQSL